MNSAVQTARGACEGNQSAQISRERAFHTGCMNLNHRYARGTARSNCLFDLLSMQIFAYPRFDVFWSRTIPNGIIMFDRLWSDSQY